MCPLPTSNSSPPSIGASSSFISRRSVEPMPGEHRPIGVFDSGMGGLTVLRALLARLPNERFVYLGDTARLPYGTKSPETVQAYALQATRVPVIQGGKRGGVVRD